jgi:hypothetical protein
MEAFLSSWGGKFIYWVGPWLVIPITGTSAIVWAVRTRWVHLAETLILLARLRGSASLDQVKAQSNGSNCPCQRLAVKAASGRERE